MSSREYSLGSFKGIGSSTRIFNFCTSHSPQPWTCIDQFANPGPYKPYIPPPGKMKTVFLLELSEGIVSPTDNVFKTTINYFWNTYPQEFTKGPIVDTKGSLDINLTALDEYYNAGYRYFVGFTSSNILTDVLSWFNNHPDATGMAIFGVSTTLNVPKNVYRFLPNNSYRIEYIPNLETAPTVYYIYQEGLLVSQDILNLLTDKSLANLQSFSANATNLTVSNLSTFLSGASSDDIIITLLSSVRNAYIDLYANGLTFPGQEYDITANQLPVILGDAAIELENKYNVVTFYGTNTSILWRNGYNFLGADNYNISALNILNTLNQFANNKQIDNINSHYGSLEFDPVKKDTLYPNVLLRKFDGTKFINTNLNIKDLYLGDYTATFTSNTPVSTEIISISPNKKFTGKAIALLELGYSNPTDYVLYQSLYFFWSKDPSLPKFPTIDITALSSSELATSLTTYYNQGYRVFLGPNFGYKLSTTDILNWFTNHPDAICISILSGVTISNIPSNIYRLNQKESETIALLAPIIQSYTKIYYIYDAGDPTGISINYFLNATFGSTHAYKSFAINSAVPANALTVANMLAFFGVSPVSNPVTGADINIIFSNINLQNYMNLYNDVSMNAVTAAQYIVSNQIPPAVPATGTVLDENLYKIQPTYPNASYLWNENNKYLNDAYGTDTTSYQLLNSLKMIEYFLAGKDIKLLGSHSGVLQFSAVDKNILFPSFLIKRYQFSTYTYANFQIKFQDPLLGVFTASFV